MINVTTKGLLDGQFTKLFKDIYTMTSSRQFRTKLPYPKELKPYLDALYGAYDLEYEFTDNKYPISTKGIKLDVHDSRCVCAFSGGKDSLANVLMLMDLGYEPILFFTKGINRSYTKEYEYSQKLADILGLEMYVYDLKVTGKCDFFENPTKNQFILALMVDWGLKQNIPNYSFGTYLDATLEDISSDYMLSDGTFMFWNVLKFYQSFFPEMDFPIFLEGSFDAFYEVATHDVNLFKNTHSCMTPLRYKNNLISKNESKYGIKLLPNRCGSCYKCCDEALVLDGFGIVDYPEDFLTHCKEVLYKFYSKYKTEDYKKLMEDSLKGKSDDYEWVSVDTIEKFDEFKEENPKYKYKLKY